jgi:hypothetical protein
MNFAMATLGLKEMGKLLWEGREKGGKRREKGRARIKNNKICCCWQWDSNPRP